MRLGSPRCPAMVKPYISTFHPTKVSQPGLARGNPGL
jgi:hypothetical protein